MKYLGNPQSGSQNGTTASHNRFGQYYRTRAIPVNPRSSIQTVARNIFASLSVGWRALSLAQRNAWESYAAAHPRVDSLGQSYTLTGLQAYVSANVPLVQSGQATIDVPGAVTVAAQVAGVTLTAAAGTPAFSVAFTVPDTGYVLQIQAGPQRSPGVQYESRFTTVGYQDDGSTTPVNLLTAYTGVFGILTAGRKIFLRSRVLDPNGLDVTGWSYTAAGVAA